MKRASVAVLVAMLVLVVVTSAQTPPQPPKPGPEHEKLGYFAGHWAVEGDLKPSPFGPGGKFTSKDHGEWMRGGFFLVIHSEWKGPMGEGVETAIIGYNAEEKAYTYDAFNSMGEAEHSKGTVVGDTWTWTSHEKMGGKVMNGRFTIKELSPTSYTFKFDLAPEGGEWATIMEGKATKTK